MLAVIGARCQSLFQGLLLMLPDMLGLPASDRAYKQGLLILDTMKPLHSVSLILVIFLVLSTGIKKVPEICSCLVLIYLIF